MNYEQAIAVRKRQIAQQPVDSHEVAMANRVIAHQRSMGRVFGNESPAPVAHAPAPAGSPSRPCGRRALCECSLRYGMHRVADFACPNPNWRPGNGEPQWLERKWKRA